MLESQLDKKNQDLMMAQTSLRKERREVRGWSGLWSVKSVKVNRGTPRLGVATCSALSASNSGWILPGRRMMKAFGSYRRLVARFVGWPCQKET